MAIHFDAELALPLLSQKLFIDIFVGFILAGLFAATISTADSQILCCTASISDDLNLNPHNYYWLTKLITVFITVAALLIALFGSDSVFLLVLIAWSALGSAFAPLTILYSWGEKPSEAIAVATMLGGLMCMLLWRFFNINEQIYEVLAGIVGGFLVYLCLKFFCKWRNK